MKSTFPRLAGVLPVGGLILALLSSARAGQYDLPDPAGGDSFFGWSITILPNGNFVATTVDAVHLYDGVTLEIISTLSGSGVGSGDVTVLENGNYVVSSPYWDDGAVPDVGAVTWGSATAGVSGVVSAANSLVGSAREDRVGNGSVIALASGNYVVSSGFWDNGAEENAGAVTWGNGTTGITGPVSTANSLVGTSANDWVGNTVTPLSNGNYVVGSPDWSNGTATNAGAVTWANGTTGITGPVSVANSLVGGAANDQVGFDVTGSPVTELVNGNYVVRSPRWNNGAAIDAGAVTWGSGTMGVRGVVSEANSLVGSSREDRIGSVTALANGNYVVHSWSWDSGPVADVGAVTWCNGSTGITGPVSAAISLVGSTAGDQVGFGSNPYGLAVTPLANGNYVVTSVFWDDGAVPDVGAVTWGNGATGSTGPVSAANSLVGSTANDRVGRTGIGVMPLANGNYVVSSGFWDNGAVENAGAATWGNGSTGINGPVSAVNSLVGSAPDDRIGGVHLLANGNYVVSSPNWDDGGKTDVGAVTWGNGTTGITGPVTAANSLVGSSERDGVGGGVFGFVTALANGNYVVSSPNWDHGPVVDAGAVTWGDGSTGMTGPVTAANSLVGSTPGDRVGDEVAEGFFREPGVTALANGNYVVRSARWDSGGLADVGAVTWGNGTSGISGPASAANSLVGTTANDKVGSGFAGLEPRAGVTPLINGDYVVSSPSWGEGNAGAVSLGDGTQGTSGVVSAANSVLGTHQSREFIYDLPNSRLLVGDFLAGRVSLFGYDPEIRIEHPLGVGLSDGGLVIFGAPLGAEDSRTFTVRNTGLGDLTGLDITIVGSGAPFFTVTASPDATVSGPLGSTTFTVRFAPTTVGLRNAVLRLANNDRDEHPFEVNLTGQALVADQDTDGDGLNDASEIELAALGFDWRVSQPGLVGTLFGNANLAGLYTASQVQALHADAPLIQRDAVSGLFTLTIGVHKSIDLMDFSPFPMSDGQTEINGQGKLEFEFGIPDDAAFFRLEAE